MNLKYSNWAYSYANGFVVFAERLNMFWLGRKMRWNLRPAFLQFLNTINLTYVCFLPHEVTLDWN
jgi:hypothetical protein